jgi:hypothetical protein
MEDMTDKERKIAIQESVSLCKRNVCRPRSTYSRNNPLVRMILAGCAINCEDSSFDLF